MLHLNDREYLESRGLNVMLGQDHYPEGHLGGLVIIQHGRRVATNGDLRLERSPGQWSAVPRQVARSVDKETGEISVSMEFPDPDKNRAGFNPVEYPDLELRYALRVRPSKNGFLISVDLDRPLPDEWVGRVAFNLELFPGNLFGRSFCVDGRFGLFPRQANGPGQVDSDNAYQIEPLAVGGKLIIAPEDDTLRMSIEPVDAVVELLDGRGQRDNGWFIARSALPAGATEGALQWYVEPHTIPDWIAPPVVQVSTIGFHPMQPKCAVVELDANDDSQLPVTLERIEPDGSRATILSEPSTEWGSFLRYRYRTLDFSHVSESGLYVITCGEVSSVPFRIDEDVLRRDVWQPTLEYFLPVQMCHMRVAERARVWHGDCHRDDARMAPVDHIHFDGYSQGFSTRCRFQPGEIVPGLDVGGWHDAGDFDLRIETQALTVYGLMLVYEMFGLDYDATTIDQALRMVEIHRPDGKPDILQQIEHGCLSIVAGYRALGGFYRGIICSDVRQYSMMGDGASQTDGEFYVDESAIGPDGTPLPIGARGARDDRWVFTDAKPWHEQIAAAALAGASRVLRGFNDELADECLRIAVEYYGDGPRDTTLYCAMLCGELLITTGERTYADALVGLSDLIEERFDRVGGLATRTVALVDDERYTAATRRGAEKYSQEILETEQNNPYGVPYEPKTWGAGWTVQRFGAQQYLLHQAFPDLFPADRVHRVLSFMLGCHPGPNNASFVSGVGVKSVTTAYGANRADWSYIPGGIVSGTGLVKPDLPELLEWPYLWQQTEYVLGPGTTDFLLLVLGAEHLLNEAGAAPGSAAETPAARHPLA